MKKCYYPTKSLSNEVCSIIFDVSYLQPQQGVEIGSFVFNKPIENNSFYKDVVDAYFKTFTEYINDTVEIMYNEARTSQINAINVYGHGCILVNIKAEAVTSVNALKDSIINVFNLFNDVVLE